MEWKRAWEDMVGHFNDARNIREKRGGGVAVCAREKKKS